jgi:sterol desaturase/sphingolipid hydroxylase (fatty acid hydroxylase superfamily)
MSEETLLVWLAQGFWVSLAFATLLLFLEGPRPLTPASRAPTGRRWLANLFVWASTWATLALLPSLSLLAASLAADKKDWGLFNQFDAPAAVVLVISFLALELSGYVVHRLEHRVPWLWRIHRLHHSDPDVDVSTTYRFHPLEVILRIAAQGGVALSIGVPPWTAVAFIVIAGLVSPFSHANVALPAAVERVLGWFILTPRVHRTHHSLDPADAETNFGVTFTAWDRFLGTLRDAPIAGHEHAAFGLDSRNVGESLSPIRMLADPFLPENAVDAKSASPIST